MSNVTIRINLYNIWMWKKRKKENRKNEIKKEKKIE